MTQAEMSPRKIENFTDVLVFLSQSKQAFTLKSFHLKI